MRLLSNRFHVLYEQQERLYERKNALSNDGMNE